MEHSRQFNPVTYDSNTVGNALNGPVEAANAAIDALKATYPRGLHVMGNLALTLVVNQTQ